MGAKLLEVTFFLDTGTFTAQAAQIVQLRPADFTAPYYFDLVNSGRINQKSSFHANPVRGNPANGEALVDIATATAHDHAFKYLDTLFGTFHDSYADPYSITNPEFGDIGAKLRLN
jgi:hypothetical protein